LWLTEFRSYQDAEFEPASQGITLVSGANGEGKTNLLEAVGFLATLRSFRGSPTDALVRVGAPDGRAVVRAEGVRESRRLLVEAEVTSAGRARAQINRQPLRRSRDLPDGFCVTVFTPDDLALVKSGPQHRREYLDGLLESLHPRHEATITEVERVIKQRNALLKSAAGSSGSGRSLAPDVISTLDVWDTKLAEAGEALARAREVLAEALAVGVERAYRDVAGTSLAGTSLAGTSLAGTATVTLAYRRSWEGGLRTALEAARRDDLRRGVTTIGPHHDDVVLGVNGLPARSHASQGEQRCVALALRLAGHQLVAERLQSSPILLLDDVFSELDPARAQALLACLPPGQAIVTTAGELPSGADAVARVRVDSGKLLT
jgi:DNA replication and repair protein RecF